MSVYPSVADLKAEADAAVQANPPSEVFLSVLLFLFSAIGWVIGRFWYVVSHSTAFIGLAVKYGYWNGIKLPPEKRVKKAASRQ